MLNLNEDAGVVVVDLISRAVVDVRGTDAISFLQRMLTQELEKTPINSTRMAVLLERKGHWVADLWVQKTADGVWLDVMASRREALTVELGKYIVVDDVALVDVSATWHLAWLIGPMRNRVLSCLNVPPPDSGGVIAAVVAGVAVQVADRPFGRWPGAMWRVPAASFSTVHAALTSAGANAVSPESFEALRIEHGVPAYPAELNEGVLPKEVGLDVAISYTKGCYVGQETTYRLHFRGQPARRLMSATLGAEAAVAGAAVYGPDGREVGKITSAANRWALVMVKREFAKIGETLRLATTEQAPTLTLVGEAAPFTQSP